MGPPIKNLNLLIYNFLRFYFYTKHPEGTKNQKVEHPASFPEEIRTRPILQTSKEFELLLDPFMGNGATRRVCDKLKKSFVGYDLKEY